MVFVQWLLGKKFNKGQGTLYKSQRNSVIFLYHKIAEQWLTYHYTSGTNFQGITQEILRKDNFDEFGEIEIMIFIKSGEGKPGNQVKN
jgi:hypothetical protein